MKHLIKINSDGKAYKGTYTGISTNALKQALKTLVEYAKRLEMESDK